MKIDIVYTYVNPDDDEWYRKRSALSTEGDNGLCRFRDNGEFKYSLRSVEKNLPWINKIFIISNSKAPEWLNTDNEKIRYIQHDEFMPADILPCFNSNVIESYIPFIEELSEHFIYINDDQMFGRYVSPNFFFVKGKPIVRQCLFGEDNESYYNSLINQAQQMIKNKFDVEYCEFPTHNADAYIKSEMINCINEFRKDFLNASKNQLRGEGDIQRVLFHYYYRVKGLCKCKKYNLSTHSKIRLYRVKSYFMPNSFFDFYFDNMHTFFEYSFPQKLIKRNPKTFCINDSEDTTEDDILRYKELMERMFPEKSGYER